MHWLVECRGYDFMTTWSERQKPVKVEIELTQREAAYLRITAFNRFLDNVNKALKGDQECKANLLGEDLSDVREYYLPVIRKVQEAIR